MPYYFCLNFVFMHLFHKILGGKANSVDPDQTAPPGAVWSGYALFAYAISSDKILYEILGYVSYYVFMEMKNISNFGWNEKHLLYSYLYFMIYLWNLLWEGSI